MKYAAMIIMVLALTYAAVGRCPSAYAGTLVRIAAAANLSAVMGALKENFSAAHPDMSVEVITGSSGKLGAQILSGAPFDLLLSADMAIPEKLAAAGLTDGPPVEYARGRLVIFTTQDIDLSRGVSVVVSSAVRMISVADPALAPYGKAAVEALTAAGVYDRVRHRMVTANSISEVVTQTVHGADVGFTALSLMRAPGMGPYGVQGTNWVEVDSALYSPIRQGMALLCRAKDMPAARRFYDFMRSPAAKGILREHGYK